MIEAPKDHRSGRPRGLGEGPLPASDPPAADEVAPSHECNGDSLDPSSKALFAKLPFIENIPALGHSVAVFGPRCVTSLSLCYFLNKGLAWQLLINCKYAMFTDRFFTSAARYQRLSAIGQMGFSIKMLPAGLSDTLACFGYTKRWYLAAASVAGGAFALGFGLLPKKASSADIAAGLSFLMAFCVATVDILSEGHYSRLMRRHPEAGTSLIGSIWWFTLAAQMVAAVVQGLLSDASLPQVGLFVAAAALALPTIFFLLNWYGEKPNRTERIGDCRLQYLRWKEEETRRAAAEKCTDDACEPTKETDVPAATPADAVKAVGARRDDNWNDEISEASTAIVTEVLTEDEEDFADIVELNLTPCFFGVFEFNKDVCMCNWRILTFSSIMIAAIISMACVTILGNTWDLLYCAVAMTVVISSSVFWACPPLVAKAAVFDYFDKLLYLMLPGALDNFYMAKPACYPDGPHFSYVFYTTVASIIGGVGGMIGVAAFIYIFSKKRYAFTFVVTTLVRVLASIFDIIIVKRWNIAIGIPDRAMYVLGDAIVYQASYMLTWMPMIVLLSRVCPRGSECMVYAIVAGFGNMGSSMSGVIGALLMELVWPVVSRGVGKCDFSNVPMLLLVGHILLPLLLIPLSFLLLPNARICDDLDVDGKPVKPTLKKPNSEPTAQPS
ncbi:putative folate/biopterin transporter [Leptomonas seymouri]|uniref:Putative folate/biopterin transporter n=1 Tax=Leptomonas seymouri TaxID=5684 RepID=A0A0N1PCC1_LEPSE|nr:putative folate/biopterin transporter [Leptomonas seymouri]|eukprot:KPI87083.1 putative folate/biopterin transporter [Leptomonas seymouri]